MANGATNKSSVWKAIRAWAGRICLSRCYLDSLEADQIAELALSKKGFAAYQRRQRSHELTARSHKDDIEGFLERACHEARRLGHGYRARLQSEIIKDTVRVRRVAAE